MRWDAGDYLRFSGERGRPFHDLLSRVAAEAPAYVVDLGCGPGNLTRALAQRWPEAQVDGVDSSPEMIERARADGETDRLRFLQADLRTWQPDHSVDVVICNATLQWVPGHLDLLESFVGALAPGGWLAFQVPGNFAAPSHVLLAEACASTRWHDRLAHHDLPRPSVEEPSAYLARLADLGCRVDVWETTYLQVLHGEDAVLHWMEGTALRPVLSVLDDADREEFRADYGRRLRAAYPRQPFGTVLPYRRIFAVAQRAAALR